MSKDNKEMEEMTSQQEENTENAAEKAVAEETNPMENNNTLVDDGEQTEDAETAEEGNSESEKPKPVEAEKQKAAEQKQKRSVQVKKSFTSRQFQSGAYSTFITVLVIAIVVIINLMFSKLDLSTDLSKGSLFTLSKDTKEVLKNNDKKITLNYMVTSGNEMDYIENVLDQYAKASNKVSIHKVDPVVNPAFASKNNITDEISVNDVIVVNEESGSAQYVSASSMYYSQSSGYDMYSQGNYYLDVEGQITSAIQGVLAENKTKMYVVSGHGEQSIAETISSAYSKLNIDTEDLELLTAQSIPEDCDILYFNGPTTDLTENEKNIVLEYLKKGGDAIINMEYSAQFPQQPNLEEILEYYGIQSTQGIVCETSGNYYYYPNYIVPAPGSSELVSKLNGYFIVPNAIRLDTMSEIRSSLKLEELMTTSEGSYLKLDPSSGSSEKESGDIDGPFAAGIAATESVGEEETKLVVFASAEIFAEE
ncbi:MAG: Gldg family protein, partial [Lachnospiraceae bacterium]|nr:Gldg family protein [Lachnospiraceae bacterium]